MDSDHAEIAPSSASLDLKPDSGARIGLVLQGGGALGAYQAGVYQALHEAGIEPDWIAGVSIGAINAALIAGNAPEHRLERLREFWDSIASLSLLGPAPRDEALLKTYHLLSSWQTATLGQPHFFTPIVPNRWLEAPGTRGATSFYDSAPLRQTLLRLIDFDLLRDQTLRFAVGAVGVETGNFTYFDNADPNLVIGPEHIMASGALPPALPMVQIGGAHFWDGGLVSNTPLQHLLDNIEGQDVLIFQVDLFPAQGPLPRDISEVLGRQKDIVYSSRTRMTTDTYKRRHAEKLVTKSLLDRIPEQQLSAGERDIKQQLQKIASVAILQLIYQQSSSEGQAKDYDFSRSSMQQHWAAGHRDTWRTLARKEWLVIPPQESGIVTHDIHRAGS